MSRHLLLALACTAVLTRGLAAQESLIRPIPASARQYAVSYDVKISFKGYSGLVEGFPMCRVDTTGVDLMSGKLTGIEMATDAGEDVIYTGILTRTTKIDFCETKRSPTEDQRGWCAISLTGTTQMEVELTVYGEAGRGAWMKAVAHPGRHTVNVTGNCDADETSQVQADYPTGDDGGGASPNGQEIGHLSTAGGTSTSLNHQGLARLRKGVYTLRAGKPGWTLEVIGRVP